MSMRSVVGRLTMAMVVIALGAGEAAAQKVQLPFGRRLTFIGARWQVDAKVVDNAGRSVPSAPLAFRIADPTIATVSSRGEVTARKPGSTTLWAVSGKDSSSALVVVEPLPSKFTFSPATVRFDALGSTQPVKVQVSDSAGVPIVGVSSTAAACRSVNPRVASFTVADGVQSVGNGVTYVRCADRGLADSVRVEVQQRAVSVLITNKVRSRTAGDTFSVRVAARDKLQRLMPDVRPTWASLNPSVVSVDPLTGRARAVNGGDAKIIVQVGDAADSTTVSVTGAALFQPFAAPAPVVDSTPPTKASLIANETFVFEAETSFVNVTATDTSGALVPFALLAFRVIDTTVAVRVDSARVVGRKSGQSLMIVRYANFVDTTTVNVRPRPAAGSAGDSSISTGATDSFRPPPAFLDSIPVYQKVRADAETAIHTDPRIAATRQNLLFSAYAVGAIADHLSRPGPDTVVTEDRTGPMFGGAGTLSLYQRFEVNGTIRLGTLSTPGSVGEDMSLAEAEGSVGVLPAPWLTIRAGGIYRREKTGLSAQTWTIPKVSVVTRFYFIGDIVNSYAALSLLPKAKFSGTTETASLYNRAGEAGVEFRKAAGRLVFNGALTYYAEQFKFENSLRLEEFSAIRFRLGLQLGR